MCFIGHKQTHTHTQTALIEYYNSKGYREKSWEGSSLIPPRSGIDAIHPFTSWSLVGLVRPHPPLYLSRRSRRRQRNEAKVRPRSQRMSPTTTVHSTLDGRPTARASLGIAVPNVGRAGPTWPGATTTTTTVLLPCQNSTTRSSSSAWRFYENQQPQQPQQAFQPPQQTFNNHSSQQPQQSRKIVPCCILRQQVVSVGKSAADNVLSTTCRTCLPACVETLSIGNP